MRSHCSVYVDAGYLLSTMAMRITGTSLRGGIKADHEALIDILATHAAEASGLPLLRVHWYDAARNGMPDSKQEEISLLPRVKLRLGRIGVDGEQKGVDLRIGLDLVAHARNAAVDAMYLISGDGDLTEAVEEAQAHGVQVTVVAVPSQDGTPRGISRHLHAAADGLDLLDGAVLDTAVQPGKSTTEDTSAPTAPATPTEDTSATTEETEETEATAAEPSPVSMPSPVLLAKTTPPRFVPVPPKDAPQDAAVHGTGWVASSHTARGTTFAPDYVNAAELDEAIDRVVNQVLSTWLDTDETTARRSELVKSRPSIPQEIDRALLRDLSDELNVANLSDQHRYRLRERFWNKFDSV